jgi:hypothetical protein
MTPALSGSERYELALLLDALQKLPAYLSGLASGEPDLVLANVVDWALGDAPATTRSRPRVRTRRATRTPTEALPLRRLADDFEDGGPFGPAHDT